MGDNKHDQAINDDQELAKVLQNMQQGDSSKDNSKKADDSEMSYEETPTAKDQVKDNSGATSAPVVAPVTPAPSVAAPDTAAPSASLSSLEALKKIALEELRPLATKLDLPAKEKFDTMLLIIRSTDDKNLLEPAHDAAKNIEDDVERAEALLDIIKEIDYFASQGK